MHKQKFHLTYLGSAEYGDYNPYALHSDFLTIDSDSIECIISYGAKIRNIEYDPLCLFKYDGILQHSDLGYTSIETVFFTFRPIVEYGERNELLNFYSPIKNKFNYEPIIR